MDFVSFETAVKLKDAGFPQHDPEQGHAWYVLFNSSEGPKSFIKFVIDDIRIAGPGPETAQRTSDINSASAVFAPTATDILRELGSNFDLSHIENPKTERWCCIERGEWDQVTPIEHYMLDNPAEACAAAWLAIHEKK